MAVLNVTFNKGLMRMGRKTGQIHITKPADTIRFQRSQLRDGDTLVHPLEGRWSGFPEGKVEYMQVVAHTTQDWDWLRVPVDGAVSGEFAGTMYLWHKNASTPVRFDLYDPSGKLILKTGYTNITMREVGDSTPVASKDGVVDNSPVVALAQASNFTLWQINEPGRNFSPQGNDALRIKGSNIHPWYFGSATMGLAAGSLRDGAKVSFDLKVGPKNENAQVMLELFQDTDQNGQIIKDPKQNWVPVTDTDWVGYVGTLLPGSHRVDIPIQKDRFQIHPNQTAIVEQKPALGVWSPDSVLRLQLNAVAVEPGIDGQGSGVADMQISNFNVVV